VNARIAAANVRPTLLLTLTWLTPGRFDFGRILAPWRFLDTRICTAEDPAEIKPPRRHQVQRQHKVGLTFAAAMRAFLRQDPDVIMVGEIRDLETRKLPSRPRRPVTWCYPPCTLTMRPRPSRVCGHGREALRLATSVSLIIAQRLARAALQNSCKQPGDGHSERSL